MKRLLLPLLVLAAASWSSAGLIQPSFTEVRPVSPDSKPGSLRTYPVEHIVEANPQDRNDPQLAQAQFDAFLARLDSLAIRNGKRGLAREQRAALSQGLRRIDYFYADPVNAGGFGRILKTMGDLAEKEIASPRADWTKITEHMLKQAVAELNDPMSRYMNASERRDFMQHVEGKLTGIGVGLRPDPRGALIEQVLPRSPAARAGLKPGDIVSAVDGATAVGEAFAAAADGISGPAGSQVRLKLAGPQPRELAITRESIVEPNLFAKRLTDTIAYLYLASFPKNVDAEFRDTVNRIRKAGFRKLVIDVRGNPGGNVREVNEIASEFLKNGQEIVSFHARDRWRDRALTDGDGDYKDMRVAVLIDDESASASEILAGALQSHKAAIVVGTRSYGKGTEQAAFADEAGGMLKITKDFWFTPSRANVQGRHDPRTGEVLRGTGGITPDVDLNLTAAQERAVRDQIRLELNGEPVPEPRTPDPVLQMAIELLQKNP